MLRHRLGIVRTAFERADGGSAALAILERLASRSIA